jgi:hypothetical protein
LSASFVRPAPRPNRPDKWGRFGLGAFLNAGKNGGAFHGPGNGLAANLARFLCRRTKIKNRFAVNSLAQQNRPPNLSWKERITDRRLSESLHPKKPFEGYSVAVKSIVSVCMILSVSERILRMR